ncbi:MAG: type II toxin-antitoxin system RelE/ParE family toxin [Flavobacteriales bacterium]
MKLRVSRAAADDLEGIWLYTVDRWSLEQADRYLGLLLDGFELIRNEPKRGRDFSQVREGYLCLSVGAHLIFYRLNEAAHEVEIIRILHERMDIENRLNP